MYVAYPVAFVAEPFSCWTHLAAAFVCLGLISAELYRRKGRERLLSRAVFAFCCVFLLLMSGMYHLLPRDGTPRMVFQRLDHAGIYLVIAGSFTAVHDALFTGFMRWGAITAIWIVAITSIVLKIVFFQSIPETVGLATYLAFGWFGVVTAIFAYRRKGLRSLIPLILGGVAYTTGALLDFLKTPVLITGVIGPHELFHIAVLAGISLHWFFISRQSPKCTPRPKKSAERDTPALDTVKMLFPLPESANHPNG